MIEAKIPQHWVPPGSQQLKVILGVDDVGIVHVFREAGQSETACAPGAPPGTVDMSTRRNPTWVRERASADNRFCDACFTQRPSEPGEEPGAALTDSDCPICMAYEGTDDADGAAINRTTGVSNIHTALVLGWFIGIHATEEAQAAVCQAHQQHIEALTNSLREMLASSGLDTEN